MKSLPNHVLEFLLENNYAVPLSFPKKLLSLQQYNYTDMNLAKLKFIIQGSDYSNTLGQIRCLGKMDISPIVIMSFMIIIRSSNGFSSFERKKKIKFAGSLTKIHK